MFVPKRAYNAIMTVNEQYDREVLENWVWNFTAEKDTELNFQVGGLEIYNLHAWQNNGGGPTMFFVFRPMSVHRGNLIDKNKDGTVDEQERKESRLDLTLAEFKMNPYSGIAPRLDENKPKVFLNGEELKVVSAAPFPEYVGAEGANDFYQTGYVIQALRGKSRVGPGYHIVRVVIEDALDYEGKMLTEKGEAFYFWRQEGNIYSVRKYGY